MEIDKIFYKNKWYKIGDKILFFPFRWEIISIVDKGQVLLKRNKKFKVIKAEVRTEWF